MPAAEFADCPVQPKKMNDKGGARVGIDVSGQWQALPRRAPEYIHLLTARTCTKAHRAPRARRTSAWRCPIPRRRVHKPPATRNTHKVCHRARARVREPRRLPRQEVCQYDKNDSDGVFGCVQGADDGPPFLRVVLSDKKDPITLRKLKDDARGHGNDGLDQEPTPAPQSCRDRGLRRHLIVGVATRNRLKPHSY